MDRFLIACPIVWEPDGSEIAFALVSKNGSDVAIVDLATWRFALRLARSPSESS